MKHTITTRLAYPVCIFVLSLFIACGRSIPGSGSAVGQNPFNGDFKDGLGSATQSLDPTQQQALKNTFAAMDQVNPEFESLVPDELMAEVEDHLGDESPEAIASNAYLAEKLLKYCAQAVSGLAPYPGETLQGQWKGSCTTNTVQTGATSADLSSQVIDQVAAAIITSTGEKSSKQVNAYAQVAKTILSALSTARNQATNDAGFDFTVVGAYPSHLSSHSGEPTVYQTENRGFAEPLPFGQGSFLIKGSLGLNSLLMAGPRGDGYIVSPENNPQEAKRRGSQPLNWRGDLQDLPHHAQLAGVRPAGTGRTSVSDCSARLVAPNHQIPEKYAEAVRQLVACVNPVILLFSPGINKMFAGMDPALAHLIKQNMLGISGGGL